MNKKWIELPPAPKDFIENFPQIPPVVLSLLWNRNIKTQEEIDEFLYPDYTKDINDPYMFLDMKKAIDIILKAIKKQEKIVVHGDYDADGVCSSTILISTLKKLGAKNTSIFIPHREIDGYGLNFNTIEKFKEEKIDLIITCDCGVSNFEEIKLAKKYGIKTIITDHHDIPAKLPPANAIIHPKLEREKYPDKTLAGAGVAFKLAQGLLKKHKEKNECLPDGEPHEGFEKWMLDIIAIATIGDMVPLIGESRTLTKFGLTVLKKTRNLGLLALFKEAGMLDEEGKFKRKINSQTVAFQIVPRLNAAGRMDHANTAFALLNAEDRYQAIDLASQLDQNNKDRQKLTESILKEARESIKDSKQSDNSMLFAYGENWSTGILGLVAGKLKDEFYKPVFAMGKNNGEITGSGRSISEFNLIKAMQEIQETDELFGKFGGHPQACGFSINPEKIETLKKLMLEKTDEKISGLELVPQINIDAVIDLEDVDWKLYDLLEKFAPFGQCNEEPKYASHNLTVVGISPVGQDGKHLRLMVKHNSPAVRKTIAFGFGDTSKHKTDWKKELKPGAKIDLAFTVGVNEWNGNRELQLTIEDIKKAE